MPCHVPLPTGLPLAPLPDPPNDGAGSDLRANAHTACCPNRIQQRRSSALDAGGSGPVQLLPLSPPTHQQRLTANADARPSHTPAEEPPPPPTWSLGTPISDDLPSVPVTPTDWWTEEQTANAETQTSPTWVCSSHTQHGSSVDAATQTSLWWSPTRRIRRQILEPPYLKRLNLYPPVQKRYSSMVDTWKAQRLCDCW